MFDLGPICLMSIVWNVDGLSFVKIRLNFQYIVVKIRLVLVKISY